MTQNILSDAEEYNRDLNEKEKEAILKAMVKQEEERALKEAEEEPESSIGRITSRMDSKGMMNAASDIKQGTIGGADTFNILPVPGGSGSISPKSPQRSSSKLVTVGRNTAMKGTIDSDVSNLKHRPSLM